MAACSHTEKRQRLIAFYGGSFTGIETKLFDRYLKTASNLVDRGVVHGAKASTRPDMVSPEIVKKLKDAGFVELELGAQSMDDEVLSMSGRGHTFQDTIEASTHIKKSELKLGLQIMPGLPGEDRKSFASTVDMIASLQPDTGRIYPTVILAGTLLERIYDRGGYIPLTLEEALRRALFAYIKLVEKGCTILRMGLPQSDNLKVIAGPYHPSFGYLVHCLAFRCMIEYLQKKQSEKLCVRVHPSDVTELIGYRRCNQIELGFSYIADGSLPRGCLATETGAKSTCLYLRDIIGSVL
ncbi:MAG: radical SAM protein [Deltaproteobacteria bacterium]|nr:radical SAM protein [Deltaproteobacteria bacterium]